MGLPLKDRIRGLAIRSLRIDRAVMVRHELLRDPEYRWRSSRGFFTTEALGATIQLRDRSSDMDVFAQVVRDQEYRFLTELFAGISTTPPRTVIDGGANIGLTSLYLRSIWPQAKIIALEPEAGNFDMLVRNTGMFPNIRPLRCALWKENTRMALGRGFRDGRDWAFHVDPNAKGDVECIRLADLATREGLLDLDVLKLDIEGAEGSVLLEDAGMDAVLQRTRVVAVEVHDELVSRIAVTDKLRSLGFRIYSRQETLYGVRS